MRGISGLLPNTTNRFWLYVVKKRRAWLPIFLDNGELIWFKKYYSIIVIKPHPNQYHLRWPKRKHYVGYYDGLTARLAFGTPAGEVLQNYPGKHLNLDDPNFDKKIPEMWLVGYNYYVNTKLPLPAFSQNPPSVSVTLQCDLQKRYNGVSRAGKNGIKTCVK